MAEEVSSSLTVGSISSSPEREYNPGKFDLYVLCRDKKEKSKIDPHKNDLKKRINQHLGYDEGSSQDILHVGDVGVGIEDFTSVQIKVYCYFYEFNHNDMRSVVKNTVEPAVEHYLNVKEIHLKSLTYNHDPQFSIKKHRTTLSITVNYERPDSNKGEFVACLECLTKSLESDKVQDYIAHSSSIMPPCLRPTGRYPMLRVAVDHIEVIEETDNATDTPGESLKALKMFQVILSKHGSQEHEVDLEHLKKEVRELTVQKICEKMKWPSSL